MNTLLSVVANAGILFLNNYFWVVASANANRTFLGSFTIGLQIFGFLLIIWGAIEDLKLAGIIKEERGK